LSLKIKVDGLSVV
jgi:hypothetical protein